MQIQQAAVHHAPRADTRAAAAREPERALAEILAKVVGARPDTVLAVAQRLQVGQGTTVLPEGADEIQVADKGKVEKAGGVDDVEGDVVEKLSRKRACR